jgi:hypothetical protein
VVANRELAERSRIRECARSARPQVVQLVVRMAKENPRWGAPRRGGPSWAEFLRAQASGTIACDFLTVETRRSDPVGAENLIRPGQTAVVRDRFLPRRSPLQSLPHQR